MDKEEKKKTEKDEAADYSATHVEKTQERGKYNAKTDRKKYDDVNKRKKYKEEQFGDKKTTKDPYNGETIHKDTNAAKNKYGEKNYNKHTAQTDHTIPIEEVAKRNRDNVFLKDEDIKKIANIKENYKVINGNTNQSKGSKSNTQTAKKNGYDKKTTKKMTKEQVKANMAVEAETAKLTVKNANQIGLNAAKSGAAIGGAVSAAQNTIAVINGDKDIPEAVLGTAVDTAKSSASSYGMAVGTKAAEGLVKKVGHEVAEKTAGKALEKAGETIGKGLVSFAESENLGRVVVVVLEAGKTTWSYLCGELSKEEFINELGEKGVALAASFGLGYVGGMVGMEIGGALGGLVGSVTLPVIGTVGGAAVGATVGTLIGEMIGSMVGYLIGSEVYKTVHKFFTEFDPGKAERDMKKYAKLADQIEAYRINLEKNFEEVRMRNNQMVMDSFEKIQEGILNNDSNLITDSLAKICNLFGEDVAFKTKDEFLRFWNNPDLVLEI